MTSAEQGSAPYSFRVVVFAAARMIHEITQNPHEKSFVWVRGKS